jgi:mono/diheme cytochrome c family protein
MRRQKSLRGKGGFVIRGFWFAGTVTLLSLFLTCGTAAGGTAVEAIAQGQTLLEKVCVVCHDDERIRLKKADRAGWQAVVRLMKANGATIDDQQGELVVAFLAARSIFEAKCSACHEFDRPLEKNKTAADWRATVERMGAKRPGHLNEAEIGQIADYLTVVRPFP